MTINTIYKVAKLINIIKRTTIRSDRKKVILFFDSSLENKIEIADAPMELHKGLTYNNGMTKRP